MTYRYVEPTFTFAGSSELKGVTKIRYANEMGRDKVLTYHGHKNICLLPLPYPMTKAAAVEYLCDIDFAGGDAAIAAALASEKAKRPS